MAITLNQSIGSISDTGPINGTLTFSSNANRVLMVAAGAHQATVGTVSLNGTAMTQSSLGTTQFNENAGLWFYNNPPAGAAGTVSVNAGGNGNFFVAMEFDGVAQTGQPSAAGSSSGNAGTALGTITTTSANNVIVTTAYSEGSFTGAVNAGETEVMKLQNQSFENAIAAYDTSVTGSGASGTEGFVLSSIQRWAIALSVLQPAGGAPATYAPHLLGLMGVGS